MLFGKHDAVTVAKEDADLELIAPVSGSLLPLADVPDLVISECIVGDGIAIIPENQEILAPCDGIISRLLSSNNAFAIRSQCGVEIYVTCGVGTKRFAGDGFEAVVKNGDKVKKGDVIIKFDMSRANATLKSTVTSIIVVKSSANIAKVAVASGKATAGETACAWVALNHDDK